MITTSCSQLKHLMHCVLFLMSLGIFITFLSDIQTSKIGEKDKYYFKPQEYDTLGYLVLLSCRLLVILALPYAIITFIGLTCFNTFPGNVILQDSSTMTPSICIRIVTRGGYPELVRETVARNIAKCEESGLENFTIEVVTDKPIGLPQNRRIREILVPDSYTSKSGALYKARALQYCLEDGVNMLADNDYIVHLDEETIMTRDSIYGIINFIKDGKHDFGQGMITYANDFVINWITTLADCKRVAEDMGRIRAQFNLFSKPIFGWKGSYMVAKVYAERDVSFDHGITGSLTEDSCFAMKAYIKDYKFAFIDGEMWERSPFTVWDFIQQRKRWLQGEILVVHSPKIAWRCKIWLALNVYARITLPLSSIDMLLRLIFPLSTPFWLNFICSFVEVVNIYTYFFGALKSLSLCRLGSIKYSLSIAASIFIIPITTLMMENIAALLAFFDGKGDFYIVDKNITFPKRSIKTMKGE